MGEKTGVGYGIYGISTYQQATNETAIYPDSIDEFIRENQTYQIKVLLMLNYLTNGLTGEAGEFANKTKKILRDGFSEDLKKGMYDEIGDVLWYLAQIANLMGWDLTDIMVDNYTKLTTRQEEGKIKGSGDNR